MAGITSELAKKSGDPPQGVSGGSPDDFCRDNIAGPHGTQSVLIAEVVVIMQYLNFL